MNRNMIYHLYVCLLKYKCPIEKQCPNAFGGVDIYINNSNRHVPYAYFGVISLPLEPND